MSPTPLPRRPLFENPSCRGLAVLASSLLLFLAACAPSPPSDEPAAGGPIGPWPQFRGVDGLGTAIEGASLPVYWTVEKGIAWKTLLPDGLGQPLAVGDRIFVTAGADPESTPRRVLIGIDAASGEILWETDILVAPKEKTHYTSSLAQTTPVADEDKVYTYFGPVLAAVGHDGELRWKQTIDPRYFEQSRYGAASSPVLVDDRILIFRDVEHGDAEHAALGWTSWIAAFSSEDGAELWRTEWRGTCCSYTTPSIVDRPDGSRQVVVASSPKILAFDLETGQELWTVDYPTVQVVPSSSVVGDLLIASGAMHDRLSIGYRIVGSGTETTLEELWQDHRQVPQISSPTLYRGRLFQITSKGVVTVLDAQTGEARKRRRNVPGPYNASLVAGDGKVYSLSSRGEVTVWQADPPFDILSVNRLPDGTGPYEAMSATRDSLLFRARYALYSVEGIPAEEMPSEEAAEEEAGAEEESDAAEGS